MAEKKSSSKEATNPVDAATQEIKGASQGSKIAVVGPVNSDSGADVFRFYRENKETIDLVPGQVLTIGTAEGQVTKGEAEILLKSTIWNFKLQ